MTTFEVRTTRRGMFVDITDQVRDAVRTSGVQVGTVTAFCPHTTAGVTIQENADPDVVHDMLLWLEQAIPQRFAGFRHAEGNSDSHIKSSLIGSSVTVIVDRGALVLGRWQGIYFCEFDGPRARQVHVQTVGT